MSADTAMIVGEWISSKKQELYQPNAYSNWIDPIPTVGYVRMQMSQKPGGDYHCTIYSLSGEDEQPWHLLSAKVELIGKNLYFYIDDKPLKYKLLAVSQVELKFHFMGDLIKFQRFSDNS
jgi:hypothetical protein